MYSAIVEIHVRHLESPRGKKHPLYSYFLAFISSVAKCLAVPPLLASVTAIWLQEIVLPSFISIGPTTHYPSAVQIAYGPFPWLGITPSGSKAFKQLALFSRSTVILSFPPISSEILFKCFHCFSLAGVVISLWSTGIYFLVKVDGSLIHVAFSLGSSTQLWKR